MRGSLDDLPVELIYQIANLLAKASWSSLNTLVCASHRYNDLLTLQLYNIAICPVKADGKRLGRSAKYCTRRGRKSIPIYFIAPPRFWACAVHWQSKNVRRWIVSKPLEWMNESVFVEPLNRTHPIEGLIHRFARAGNLEMVKLLVEKGVDVDRQHNCGLHASGQSALGVASSLELEELVLYLLECGAQPFLMSKKICYNQFSTIIYHKSHRACVMHNSLAPDTFFGHDRIILKVLEGVGNEIQVSNALATVMLRLSVERGLFPIVSSLLQIPLKLFSSSTYIGEHELERPATWMGGSYETFEKTCEMIFELVRRRPGITIMSQLVRQDDTPLIVSIELKLWSIARILIRSGIDLEAVSSKRGPTETRGAHALQIAIALDASNLLDDLIHYGPTKWDSARMQYTLYCAVRAKSVSRIQMILKLLRLGKIDLDLNIESSDLSQRDEVRIILGIEGTRLADWNTDGREVRRLLIEAGAR